MTRIPLTLFFLLLLLPGLSHAFTRDTYPLPTQASAGFSTFNDLLGVQLEVANPVGSVYLMVGGHLSRIGIDDWAEGSPAGFVAGFRFFADGYGLDSSWYVTGFGGTLGVERRREDGERKAYQRLGLGGGLGYQHVTERARLGFTLGVARLEPVDTDDGDRVDRDFFPTVETYVGFRF
ncbi:MAG: hypothetical protein JJU06_22060 [Ectothiorhodospiraceae bacterium]|nr:hypothetical protein [Ectothiorhodospiraceae bacterium]